MSSNSTSLVRQREPSSRASTPCTMPADIGGAESCSRVSWARYGAATSSGRADSRTDSTWPNFIAPPLSSPRVRNSCSAVRCCTSVITASAGAPPRRRPTPSAVRPAKPSGSAARRAVRAAALRGSSVMPPLLPSEPRSARRSRTRGAAASRCCARPAPGPARPTPRSRSRGRLPAGCWTRWPEYAAPRGR